VAAQRIGERIRERQLELTTQAMGLDIDAIGDTSIQPKKASAPPISLTGALSGLV
jgi:hypothetical protein